MKKFLATTAVFGLGVTLFAGSGSAEALDIKNGTGTATFRGGDITIVEPDPDDPGIAGLASMDFSFPEVVISETYSQHAEDAVRVAVSDFRGVANSGWDLLVSQEGQFVQGGHYLTGWELTFAAGQFYNVTGYETLTDRGSWTPLGSPATINFLPGGTAQRVAGYTGDGGNFLVEFANTNITLESGANNQAIPRIGAYTTTLVWSLANVVPNGE